MKLDAKTPTREITIQNISFKVPQPFSAGHPLSEMEAKVINQTLAENLRNNFAGAVKKAEAEAEKNGKAVDKAVLQTALNTYIGTYEFGVRHVGLDPVEREALDMATERVKEALKGKGFKLSEVGKEKIAELASDAVEKNPEFTARAKQIVAERSKIGESALKLDI